MKKDTKKMQATTTRNVLAFVLVIVILGSAAGFYFGLQIIKAYAIEVTHAVTDSHASGTNVKDLNQLKLQLAAGQGLVQKADSLFSTPATYQTQALKDISKYASEAGISISSIDSAKPAAATSASATSTVAATPNSSEIITIQSPVSYVKFIQFLDAIEGNLPKMQITGIAIGRPAATSGDQITTEKITITVSTR